MRVVKGEPYLKTYKPHQGLALMFVPIGACSRPQEDRGPFDRIVDPREPKTTEQRGAYGAGIPGQEGRGPIGAVAKEPQRDGGRYEAEAASGEGLVGCVCE